jgi:hypothetical protein
VALTQQATLPKYTRTKHATTFATCGPVEQACKNGLIDVGEATRRRAAKWSRDMEVGGGSGDEVNTSS